jgi:hypothetical protein
VVEIYPTQEVQNYRKSGLNAGFLPAKSAAEIRLMPVGAGAGFGEYFEPERGIMIIKRSVTVQKPVSEVFSYLADFTTTTNWDPGSVKTELISGDGGVGSKYHNISKFNGKETELIYEVLERDDANGKIVLRGENKTVIATDTITVVPAADGTGAHITYQAAFKFKGITVIAEPFLRGAFQKLGDEAEEGLRRTFS